MKKQREANEDETLYALQLIGCLSMLNSVRKALLDEFPDKCKGKTIVKDVDGYMVRCEQLLQAANGKLKFSASEILSTATRIVYEAERCFMED